MIIKLKTIKKVFKESKAVEGCKDRLMLLTKGGGNTERLIEELWEDFKESLKRAIEESKNKPEDTKTEGNAKQEQTQEQEQGQEQGQEQEPKEKITWRKFLSNKLKEGKKIQEIGKLWKEEKEKNK